MNFELDFFFADKSLFDYFRYFFFIIILFFKSIFMFFFEPTRYIWAFNVAKCFSLCCYIWKNLTNVLYEKSKWILKIASLPLFIYLTNFFLNFFYKFLFCSDSLNFRMWKVHRLQQVLAPQITLKHWYVAHWSTIIGNIRITIHLIYRILRLKFLKFFFSFISSIWFLVFLAFTSIAGKC